MRFTRYSKILVGYLALILSASAQADDSKCVFLQSDPAGTSAFLVTPLGDISGDAVPEMLIEERNFVRSGSTIGIYSRDGTLLFTPQSDLSIQCRYLRAVVNLGDINADGYQDLLFNFGTCVPIPYSAYQILSGKDGTPLSTGFVLGNYDRSADLSQELELLDLNGDGTKEIGVFVPQSGVIDTFSILSGVDRSTLKNLTLPKSFTLSSSGIASGYQSNFYTEGSNSFDLGDVDADGNSDVLELSEHPGEQYQTVLSAYTNAKTGRKLIYAINLPDVASKYNVVTQVVDLDSDKVSDFAVYYRGYLSGSKYRKLTTYSAISGSLLDQQFFSAAPFPDGSTPVIAFGEKGDEILFRSGSSSILRKVSLTSGYQCAPYQVSAELSVDPIDPMKSSNLSFNLNFSGSLGDACYANLYISSRPTYSKHAPKPTLLSSSINSTQSYSLEELPRLGSKTTLFLIAHFDKASCVNVDGADDLVLALPANQIVGTSVVGVKKFIKAFVRAFGKALNPSGA